MTAEPAFAVDPWTVTETALDLGRLAQAESVFALSNGHIGMRGNLDEGEPHGHARHVPEQPLRTAPVALRRGGLRLPRVRSDDHQRHQRQADPAARRRRTARRPLRHVARTPAASARSPRRHAHPHGALALAGRMCGPGALHPHRLAHPTRDRSRRVRGDRRGRADRAVVQSELVANEPHRSTEDDPACRPCSSRRCCSRRTSSTAPT